MRRQQLRGAARLPSDLKVSGGGDSSSSEAAAVTAAVTDEGHRGKGLVEEGIERLPFKLTQNQQKGKPVFYRSVDWDEGRMGHSRFIPFCCRGGRVLSHFLGLQSTLVYAWVFFARACDQESFTYRHDVRPAGGLGFARSYHVVSVRYLL